MSQAKLNPTVDLGYPTEARGRIPAFANVEEEAAFWDTHDFTDFEAESSPVQITVGQELAERLTLRLDHADRQELVRRANAKGIGPSTLARMWIKERLRQEHAAEADALSGEKNQAGCRIRTRSIASREHTSGFGLLHSLASTEVNHGLAD